MGSLSQNPDLSYSHFAFYPAAEINNMVESELWGRFLAQILSKEAGRSQAALPQLDSKMPFKFLVILQSFGNLINKGRMYLESSARSAKTVNCQACTCGTKGTGSSGFSFILLFKAILSHFRSLPIIFSNCILQGWETFSNPRSPFPSGQPSIGPHATGVKSQEAKVGRTVNLNHG